MGNPKPYSWDQTAEEVHINIPIEAAIKGKDVVFTLAPNSLKVSNVCAIESPLPSPSHTRLAWVLMPNSLKVAMRDTCDPRSRWIPTLTGC